MTIRRVVQTGADQSARASTPATDLAALRSVDRNRRTVRATELIEAVQRLDTTTDPATAQAIMKWIQDEYEERQGGRLVGLFSRCHLGEPYLDHRLDMAGNCILEHFEHSQSPPVPYAAARPLVRSDAYTFVEIYDDGATIPIRPDGRPVL